MHTNWRADDDDDDNVDDDNDADDDHAMVKMTVTVERKTWQCEHRIYDGSYGEDDDDIAGDDDD